MSGLRFAIAFVAVALGAPVLFACGAEGGNGSVTDPAAVTQFVAAGGPGETEQDLKARRKFYVAPNGRPDGKGTKGSPWDLQTALDQPSTVEPGAVIWLRGGTYAGSFVSKLNGTPAQRITVRQYPNERATIDAGLSLSPALLVNGSYTTFWGFELTSSNPARYITSGDGARAEGMTIYGPGTRLVNLIIHDGGNGVGFWEQATDAEITGCIIYNNGFLVAGHSRGSGHGVYFQNHAGLKKISDVVVFNNFGFGLHGYSQAGWVQNVRIEGAASFNNGAPGSRGGFIHTSNLFVGTTHNPVDQITVTNCYTYQPALMSGGSMGFGYDEVENGHMELSNSYMADGAGGMQVKRFGTGVVTGNTIVVTPTGLDGADSSIALVATPTGVVSSAYTWNNNQYYDTSAQHVTFAYDSPNWQSFAQWKAASGFDATSSYTMGRPSGTQVFVRPNPEEAGRAHIIVYNWAGRPNVKVDLDAVLQPGQSYEVRNVQDYYGAPVLTGVFTGGSVQLPMTGLTVATPYGYDFTPPSTAPEFNVFVVQVRREARKDAE